jgi:hypothetical protein
LTEGQGIHLEPKCAYTLAHGQTRQLSFAYHQVTAFAKENPFISFTLIFQQVTEEGEVAIASLPFLFEIAFYTLRSVLKGASLLGTHYHAGTMSFLAVAPKEKVNGAAEVPILFLRKSVKPTYYELVG